LKVLDIERKVKEKKINSLIGNTNDKKYVIVIGEKGTGKTSLIEHCINGKIGIIKRDLDTKNLKESLLLSIGYLH
jgi:Ni2+-binding GTPase involved in maturation of urease and hydrogenase